LGYLCYSCPNQRHIAATTWTQGRHGRQKIKKSQGAIVHRLKFLGILMMLVPLAGCTTTSGSTRLDESGERLAVATDDGTAPETSAYYIRALRGGLVSRIATVKLSNANRSRALEAEYKALESAPGGQSVVWEGDGGTTGAVMVAVPYQVGSQNCRQYTHTVSIKATAPQIARGAACRNANGSWTPLI
jgi:surface antigen